jgi:hypothetical protein
MIAMHRFFANVTLRACCIFSRRFALALLLLAAVAPRPAHAVSKEEATDFAVDAFFKAAQAVGSQAGITIPDAALELVKQMVLCGVDGNSVPACARESVIKTALKNAPEDVQKVASCLVNSGDPVACAKAMGLEQVPAQVRPIVECLLGGATVQACAGKVAVGEILARTPKEVRPLVECMARGTNVGECAKTVAIDQLPDGDAKELARCVVVQAKQYDQCVGEFGEKQLDAASAQAVAEVQKTLDQLKELKADTENAMENLKGSVYNIIQVAQGIEEGRVDKIINGAGPELAKIIITQVIVGMAPAAGPIAGPVVGALVDLYVDTGRALIKEVVELFTTGDPSGVASIIIDFYFNEMIARPCALIPEGGFNDATCGNLAKVISAVADWGGEAFGLLHQISLEVLSLDPFSNFLNDMMGKAWKEIKSWFGDDKEDEKVCGTREAYFANNHLVCLGAATAAVGPGLAKQMHSDCWGHFFRCFDGKGSTAICNSLESSLNGKVGQIKVALAEGADMLASKALGTYLTSRQKELCDAAYADNIDRAADDFLADKCTQTLAKMVPLKAESCKVKNYSPLQSPHAAACAKADTGPAREAMKSTCKAYCASTKIPGMCSNYVVHDRLDDGRTKPKFGDIWATLDNDDIKGKGLLDGGGSAGHFGDSYFEFALGQGSAIIATDNFMIGKCAPRFTTYVASSNRGSDWPALRAMTLSRGFDACGLGNNVPTAKGGTNSSVNVTTVSPPSLRTPAPPKLGRGPGGGDNLAYPGGTPARPGGSKAMDILTGDGLGGGGSVRPPGGGPAGGDWLVKSGGTPVRRPGTGSGGGGSARPSGGGPAGGDYLAYPGGTPVPRPSTPNTSSGAPKSFGRSGGGSIDYGFSSSPPPKPPYVR